MKRIVCLACALLVGCSSGPTGHAAFTNMANMEGRAIQGQVPWIDFYNESIRTIDLLVPDPFLTTLRAHYVDMRPFAQAFSDGRINADEFKLILDSKQNVVRQALATAQRNPPRLYNERSGTSASDVAAILGAISLGVTAASLAAPPPPRPVNCVTSQMGAFMNTRCY